MDAKKCDRCGRFYEESNSTYEVSKPLYTTALDGGRFVYARKKIDLCQDCADALVRFLYNAEPEENEQ